MSAGAVESLTSPPSPPPVTFTDEVPCSSEASSMKYDGIIEKSVMPSIGLLMRMPFHVTCVCEGPCRGTTGREGRPAVLFDEDRRVEGQHVGDRQGDVLFQNQGVEPGLLHADSFHRSRPQTRTSRMVTTPFPATTPRRSSVGPTALHPAAPETAVVR